MQISSRGDAAIQIVESLIKNWHFKSVNSACDLLDDLCEAAENLGVVGTTDRLRLEKEAATEDALDEEDAA